MLSIYAFLDNSTPSQTALLHRLENAKKAKLSGGRPMRYYCTSKVWNRTEVGGKKYRDVSDEMEKKERTSEASYSN